MICTYSLTIRCACPVDDLPDVYQVVFESTATIKVEDIIEAVGQFEVRKLFQEDLTASLARTIGCKVTTSGFHSGVKTTVVAP